MWSYPTVDPNLREILLRKCTLRGGESDRQQPLPYLYGHLGDVWYYLYNQDTEGKIDKVVNILIM